MNHDGPHMFDTSYQTFYHQEVKEMIFESMYGLDRIRHAFLNKSTRRTRYTWDADDVKWYYTYVSFIKRMG